MLIIVSCELRQENRVTGYGVSMGINLPWLGYSFVTIVTTPPFLDKAWFVSDVTTRLSTVTTLH
jgi:hypothetical protein